MRFGWNGDAADNDIYMIARVNRSLLRQGYLSCDDDCVIRARVCVTTLSLARNRRPGTLQAYECA
jgi:hypothetical protein